MAPGVDGLVTGLRDLSLSLSLPLNAHPSTNLTDVGFLCEMCWYHNGVKLEPDWSQMGAKVGYYRRKNIANLEPNFM